MFSIAMISLYAIVLLLIVMPSGACSYGLKSRNDSLRVNPRAIRNGTDSEFCYRDISSEEVSTIMRAVMDSSNRSRPIIILYGKNYKEVIYSRNYPFNQFVALMYLKNEGRTELLQKILDTSEMKKIILLLDTPANIIFLFQRMRKKMLQTYMANWLLLMEGSHIDDSVAKLREFVSEGTQVNIIWKTVEGPFYHYLPLVDHHGYIQFENRGKWKGIKEELKALFSVEPKHPYSLNGRQFTIAVKDLRFTLELGRSLPDGSVEIVSGGDLALINAISSNLNFTYKAFIPSDNVWGDVLPDGNITGIIGMVARREVTLGMSGLIYSAKRLSVTHFTHPYHVIRVLLLSRSPKEKNRAFAILRTFSLQTWGYLALALTLIGPVVFVIAHLADKYLSLKESILDLQWCQFNMFRSMVNQGNQMSANSQQVRLILSFWFLFCVIVSALYSGTLTAVLAIPEYETPIDFLQDLPRAIEDGFTVGTLGGSSYENMFKTASEGVYKQTWNLFNHEDRSRSFVGNVYHGIRRVLDDKFIFIISDGYAKIYSEMFGETKFHLSRQRLSPSYIAMACQRGSPALDPINLAVLRMADTGLLQKMTDDATRVARLSLSSGETETKNQSITLKHLQAAFYIFFLGLTISSIFLLKEIGTLKMREM